MYRQKDIFRPGSTIRWAMKQPGGAWYPDTIEGLEEYPRIVSNGNYVMLVAVDGADSVVRASTRCLHKEPTFEKRGRQIAGPFCIWMGVPPRPGANRVNPKGPPEGTFSGKQIYSESVRLDHSQISRDQDPARRAPGTPATQCPDGLRGRCPGRCSRSFRQTRQDCASASGPVLRRHRPDPVPRGRRRRTCPLLGTMGTSFSAWQSQLGETSSTKDTWKQGRPSTTALVYSAIFLFKMAGALILGADDGVLGADGKAPGAAHALGMIDGGLCRRDRTGGRRGRRSWRRPGSRCSFSA